MYARHLCPLRPALRGSLFYGNSVEISLLRLDSWAHKENACCVRARVSASICSRSRVFYHLFSLAPFSPLHLISGHDVLAATVHGERANGPQQEKRTTPGEHFSSRLTRSSGHCRRHTRNRFESTFQFEQSPARFVPNRIARESSTRIHTVQRGRLLKERHEIQNGALNRWLKFAAKQLRTTDGFPRKEITRCHATLRHTRIRE